ncbi:hypothetical protein [Ferrovibrio xuzhouensis]|uniref:Uncharacterized protein n=1 Tax=Ferrovibrio xuzhouensis TaxID=1576914 RepID=A0ABV7VJ15_9PROT
MRLLAKGYGGWMEIRKSYVAMLRPAASAMGASGGKDRLPGGMSQIVVDMLSKKRLEFSSDAEIRFVTDSLTVDEKWAGNLVGSHIDSNVENPNKFVHVEIDLDKMIDAIVLHPKSGSEYKNKIINMIEMTRDNPSDLIQKIKTSSLA